jgi:membrane-associated protease RseP (regulator of RpoE activity)
MGKEHKNPAVGLTPTQAVRGSPIEKAVLLGLGLVAFAGALAFKGLIPVPEGRESTRQPHTSVPVGVPSVAQARGLGGNEARAASRAGAAVSWSVPREQGDPAIDTDTREPMYRKPAGAVPSLTRAYGSYLLQARVPAGDAATAMNGGGMESTARTSYGMTPLQLSQAGTTPAGAGTDAYAVSASVAEKIGAGLSAHSGGGIEVDQVLPGSIAGKLGLEPGDVILAVNGTFVDSPADLARIYQADGMPRQLDALRGGAPVHRHP